MTARRSLLIVACLLLVGCGSTASARSVKMPPTVDIAGE